MLHPLPLPLSSCLGCIPPLIGLPSLRFYAVGSSLFLLSVCFCLCSLFYRDDVLCWLLLARPFLYAFHAHLRFPVDLVWFRLSCDHGWIRSGSVNVRKQQQQHCIQHTSGMENRHSPTLSRQDRQQRYRKLYLGCMFGHHIQQSMDQPKKVANPACGQLSRKNVFFFFLSQQRIVLAISLGHHPTEGGCAGGD